MRRQVDYSTRKPNGDIDCCANCGLERELIEGLNGKKLLERRDYCPVDGQMLCQTIRSHQICDRWQPEPQHDGHFKSGR